MRRVDVEQRIDTAFAVRQPYRCQQRGPKTEPLAVPDARKKAGGCEACKPCRGTLWRYFTLYRLTCAKFAIIKDISASMDVVPSIFRSLRL